MKLIDDEIATADRPTERTPARKKASTAAKKRRRSAIRRRAVAGGLILAALVGAAVFLSRDPAPLKPSEVRGSAAWARKHYGNANSPKFRERHIVEIDFLGEPMYVHEDAQRHFLRLARIFEARAPEYAAQIAVSPDDWSYNNRDIRGGEQKSNHAYGLAVDINALTNVLGTEGDMPQEVILQWEIEGGDWGGDWARPDPMHFETHLTPAELRKRYHPDGTPTDWYLEQLTG